MGNHVLSVEYGGSSDSTLLDVLRSECTVRYVSGVDVCRVSLSELDQHTVTPEQGHARAQASPQTRAGSASMLQHIGLLVVFSTPRLHDM